MKKMASEMRSHFLSVQFEAVCEASDSHALCTVHSCCAVLESLVYCKVELGYCKEGSVYCKEESVYCKEELVYCKEELVYCKEKQTY